MTGRGVDQILPHPGDPRLHESYVRYARRYVELAEAVNGAIPRPVEPWWIWGDSLQELERIKPDARIINLETSVTRSDEYWRGKAIHYRMHPDNVGCLTAAGIDACVLGNNHVLDFGHAGLAETLRTLRASGIHTVGTGWDVDEARRPAVIDLGGRGRIIILSLGSESSGVPPRWAAAPEHPGVDLLPDLSQAAAAEIVGRISSVKRPGDILIASVHWGSNWGYGVPSDQVRFAHLLVEGGVDVVHGHSSHHPRPVEVHRGRLILYGCGDFIDDYEGIGGHEEFRDDLVVMYFPSFASGTGELLELRMIAMQIRKMRLSRASQRDVRWLRDVLDQVSRPFGSRIAIESDQTLRLQPAERNSRARTTSVLGEAPARQTGRLDHEQEGRTSPT